MTPRTTYIAAPYYDPDPAVRAWHADRATLVARMLLHEGAAPVYVHAGIEAGAYGDDADHAQRERGLAAACAIAAACADLFVLLRDDGSMSDGMRVEWRAWFDAPLIDDESRRFTRRWSDLADRMTAAGLADRWRALAVWPEVTA